MRQPRSRLRPPAPLTPEEIARRRADAIERAIAADRAHIELYPTTHDLVRRGHHRTARRQDR